MLDQVIMSEMINPIPFRTHFGWYTKLGNTKYCLIPKMVLTIFYQHCAVMLKTLKLGQLSSPVMVKTNIPWNHTIISERAGKGNRSNNS